MIPLTLRRTRHPRGRLRSGAANFGVAPAEAVAISLLAFFLGAVLASLPGTIIFAHSGLGRTTAATSSGVSEHKSD